MLDKRADHEISRRCGGFFLLLLPITVSRFCRAQQQQWQIRERAINRRVTRAEFYSAALPVEQSRSRPRLLPLRAAGSTRALCTRCERLHTGAREKRKVTAKRIRKGRVWAAAASPLRIRPLSSSPYIQAYDWLPYKDLYTALSMLTHRLNVSLESLSLRGPRTVRPGPENSTSRRGGSKSPIRFGRIPRATI